jgi:hypothetical protein
VVHQTEAAVATGDVIDGDHHRFGGEEVTMHAPVHLPKSGIILRLGNGNGLNESEADGSEVFQGDIRAPLRLETATPRSVEKSGEEIEDVLEVVGNEVVELTR